MSEPTDEPRSWTGEHRTLTVFGRDPLDAELQWVNDDDMPLPGDPGGGRRIISDVRDTP